MCKRVKLRTYHKIKATYDRLRVNEKVQSVTCENDENFSMEGIREGYLFRQKCYIKGLDLEAEWASPSLLSSPPGVWQAFEEISGTSPSFPPERLPCRLVCRCGFACKSDISGFSFFKTGSNLRPELPSIQNHLF